MSAQPASAQVHPQPMAPHRACSTDGRRRDVPRNQPRTLVELALVALVTLALTTACGNETRVDFAVQPDSGDSDATMGGDDGAQDTDTGEADRADAPPPEVGPVRDVGPTLDIEPAPIRCDELDCAGAGRACVEPQVGVDAVCGACLSGFVEVADECVASDPPMLGVSCASDAACGEGGWCNTAPGFERCSPRLFAGQSHQMDFVFVPSGTFVQGTPESPAWRSAFTATLTRDYFISQTEVTQGQWMLATGTTNPSEFYQRTSGNTSIPNERAPVEMIDWYSALAYANWLSDQNGLERCYIVGGCDDPDTGWHDGQHSGCGRAAFVGLDCPGYRLPIESEWERAARAGSTSTYYWGEANDWSTLNQNVWYSGNAGSRTQAVAQKSMNAYGLFDMIGNVSEWVWDRFDALYPVGSVADYTGSAFLPDRASRGGNWSDVEPGLRSAGRIGVPPNFLSPVRGFRLARTAP